MQLSIDIAGKEKLADILKSYTGRIGSLKPAFDSIVSDLYKLMEDQFSSQGVAGTRGAWKPLSPAYADWKKKNYPGRPLLVLKGDLKNSLTRSGGENIAKTDNDSMEFGSSLKTPKGDYGLGMLHQKGTKKMYARRILDLRGEIVSRFIKTIRNYIMFVGSK